MVTKNIQKDLTNHPAYKAWKRLYKKGPEPSVIEILKENTKLGWGTYRIYNIGFNSSAVIAKRCQLSKALNEIFIYEKILPQIPVTRINFYGSITETNEKFCWLFIEDAGEEEYCSLNNEHCNYCAHYLSVLHKHSAPLPLLNCLPDRSTDYYFEQLKYSKENILDGMGNNEIEHKDKEFLDEAYAVLKLLIMKWKDIEVKCNSIPKTFVHGDTKVKHTRIKAGNVTTIIMFDWELGGYGFPLVDLALIAGDEIECFEDNKNRSYCSNTLLEAYWNSMNNSWDNITKKDFYILFLIGRILRFIPFINWRSYRLKSNYNIHSKSIEKKTFIILESYFSQISNCLKELKYSNS